ncbi:Triose-phosphate Transporter [Xylographa bjoerkii]|nr:Triose-phosphate Transporter [Xylographa bjoerkii]MCJ1396125.1 Triose-phosphate Transporter [Xylographa bjoerkii]
MATSVAKEAALLEENQWVSSPPHPRTPNARLSLSSLTSHGNLLSHNADGTERENSTESDMMGNADRRTRRRRSQDTSEKGELNSTSETTRSRQKNSGAQEICEPRAESSSHYDSSPHSSRSTSQDDKAERLSEEEGLTDDEETGLTTVDKGKRRRRKRRHTLLDERIAGDAGTSKQERKLADFNVLKNSAINALLISSWYLFSLSISIYNKWMFSPEHLNFHFPLFTTCMHMLVQFSLASAVLFFIPHFRPRADSISNPHNLSTTRDLEEPLDPKKPLMTAKFYLSRIAPCGAATGLDIGLGNMSLKYITLTFFTMCKSSALAFVLLFAFVFHLETPSIKLILIIATMTIGVIMMVAGETAFNVLGFILIISSAFFSGFRWALTQILLLRNPATSNPFSSIFFLAPIMFISLAILAFPIEGFGALKEGLDILTEAKGTFVGIVLLLFPGVLAFCMTSSEFALLQRTSVVTLSICGIFKEVVTISAAGIVFHDPLTPINVSGLLVTIVSIAAYNYIKITKMRREAREKLKDEVVGTEVHGMLESEEAEQSETRERTSTRSMVFEAVRTSLTLITPGRDGANSDGRERHSPTKQPEDLD